MKQDIGTSTSQGQYAVHVTKTSASRESKAEKVTTEETLDVIWDQFLKETNPKKQQTLLQTYISQTPIINEKTSFTVEACRETMNIDDLEIILVFLTSQVILNIEEIPPLDIFYSLKHIAVVNRQRKRRSIEQRQALVPTNTSFQVLWKDAQVTLAKDLGRLSQYGGAYVSAKIGKAKEVKQLRREKDGRIRNLEENLENEKQGIIQQWKAQFTQLQTSFGGLKIQYESNMKSWDAHIEELERRIEQLKANPETTKFMKEAGELNNPLSHQQVLFCQKLAIIEEMCQSAYALVNQLSNLRTHSKEFEKKIFDFID